ncbi:MAG: hypothetical protein KGL39_12060 [Patescibacteria group bacterium]|nr:hypothetical protein [Patescibacteria group bacterium]
MKNPAEAGRAAARKTFERFHQSEPDRTFKVNIPDLPDELTYVAEVEELVYHVPDGVPSERGGVNFRHSFGDRGDSNTGAKPLLLAHPTQPVLVIVPKPGEPPWSLTERGIVG